MLNHSDNPLPESLREDVVLLALDQVAKLLGVSPRTIWRLVSAGKILAPVRIGKATRWRYRDLRQWLDSGCPPQESGRK